MTPERAHLALAGIVLASGVGVGAYALSPDEEQAPAPAVAASSCSFLIGERGELHIPTNDGVCTFVFLDQTWRKPTCEMHPIVPGSIKEQWSYDTTADALVVKGLKPGAHVAFTCKEPK